MSPGSKTWSAATGWAAPLADLRLEGDLDGGLGRGRRGVGAACGGGSMASKGAAKTATANDFPNAVANAVPAQGRPPSHGLKQGPVHGRNDRRNDTRMGSICIYASSANGGVSLILFVYMFYPDFWWR